MQFFIMSIPLIIGLIVYSIYSRKANELIKKLKLENKIDEEEINDLISNFFTKHMNYSLKNNIEFLIDYKFIKNTSLPMSICLSLLFYVSTN